MHVVAHIGGTVLPNGTYTGGKVSHIGQVFFDQSLITKVEALPPYNTNTQRLTTNSADRVVAAEVCIFLACFSLFCLSFSLLMAYLPELLY